MSELKCFVIMPFKTEFDAVFEVVRDAVQNATPNKTIACHWLKDVHAAGRITDDILDSLDSAALTVADVTGSNPNVMWETGFAMALGKPTILIGQGMEDLPFDLKTHRVIGYSLMNLPDFRPRLSEAVRQTLTRYDLGSAPTVTLDTRTPSSIAVTGSFEIDPGRIQKRLGEMLTPYTEAGVAWYCGGVGDADEAILRFLTGIGESVSVVINHPLDFTEGVRELVDRSGLRVIDASIEPLPKGFSGPSERDTVMCIKADMIVLFWNGHSPVIRKLARYFQSKEKSVLVVFV